MKVTIISLGLVKVFILNELNENVIECQKEKTGGPDIISELPSDYTQEAQKLSLVAPCEHDKKHDNDFLDYNCSVASLNKSQNIDYFQYLIPNYT